MSPPRHYLFHNAFLGREILYESEPQWASLTWAPFSFVSLICSIYLLLGLFSVVGGNKLRSCRHAWRILKDGGVKCFRACEMESSGRRLHLYEASCLAAIFFSGLVEVARKIRVAQQSPMNARTTIDCVLKGGLPLHLSNLHIFLSCSYSELRCPMPESIGSDVNYIPRKSKTRRSNYGMMREVML